MNAPERQQRVCAVVVIYHPDAVALRKSMRLVCPQVGATVVVDNGSDAGDEVLSAALGGAGISVIRNAENAGLARALNQGIEWARKHGHSDVLLLDQDSMPAPDMVRALFEARDRCQEAQGVAAVGPTLLDPRNGRQLPFVRFGFPANSLVRSGRSNPTAGSGGAMSDDVVGCDFLVTSGSLISMDVLDRVGPMDEGLFIDNIDVEWCFRARKEGYGVYGAGGATMTHPIGESLMFGTKLHVHGPERLYYIMRNRLLLYRLPHTPWVWVAQDALRIPVKFVLMALFAPNRLKNTANMLAGLWDGIIGRRGALPDPG